MPNVWIVRIDRGELLARVIPLGVHPMRAIPNLVRDLLRAAGDRRSPVLLRGPFFTLAAASRAARAYNAAYRQLFRRTYRARRNP